MFMLYTHKTAYRVYIFILYTQQFLLQHHNLLSWNCTLWFKICWCFYAVCDKHFDKL